MNIAIITLLSTLTIVQFCIIKMQQKQIVKQPELMPVERLYPIKPNQKLLSSSELKR